MKEQVKIRRHSVSIRWSLFKNLLTLVILISGSLLIYSMIGTRRAMHQLSESLFAKTSDSFEAQLAEFFAPISKSVTIVAGLGERGFFSPDDPQAAGRLLLPVVDAIPQLSSICTGDSDGNAFVFTRQDGIWHTVQIAGEEERWREIDRHGATVKAWVEVRDFNTLGRPWHELGMNSPAGEVRWTEVYRFVPNFDPGITAAVHVAGSPRPYAMAFDVLLHDFAKFAHDIEVPSGGLAFVITDDGRMLVPPVGADGDLDELLLKLPNELGMPVVDECVRRWREDQSGAGAFRFQHAGEAWWCGFRASDFDPQMRVWTAVIVPEKHFMIGHRQHQMAVVFVTLAALAVAVLMASLLSLAYSRPMGELVEHSHRLAMLETGVAVDVSTNLREVRQLATAQEHMRLALDSFARYVPVGVVRDLLDRGEAARIDGREAELTVLFTDIAGFTSIAESMPAAELTRHMAEYFGGVVEILQRHGATVDKFIGDAVMAFWGAPNAQEHHSAHAVEAVLEIREWLEEANRRWRDAGRPELHTRFGLAAGIVIVGNVGSERRLSYTALGDAVNLACRLEELNRDLGTHVLADENVWRSAGDGCMWREHETTLVRGRKTLVRVFELVGRVQSR